MQLCYKHWDALRREVCHQEMEHLISWTRRDGPNRASTIVDGTKVTLDNFDPLIQANWWIFEICLEQHGPELIEADFFASAAQPICPLCFCREWHKIIKVSPDVHIGWLKSSAIAQFEVWSHLRDVSLVT